MTTKQTCHHGQLKRSCQLCEYEARIEELEADQMRNRRHLSERAEAMDVFCSERDAALEKIAELQSRILELENDH